MTATLKPPVNKLSFAHSSFHTYSVRRVIWCGKRGQNAIA
jgi:hypothetical protein